MAVRLRLLGTGDAFGTGGRFQTCFHLEHGEGSLLVDCGASSLIALKRAGLDPSSIGAVLLTHLHGDHFGGIPFLVLDGQFAHRELPLVVAGPAGVRDRVERAMEVLFPGSTEIEREFAVTFVEYAARRPARVGPAEVLPYPVPHRSGAEAFALRVRIDGRVLACSGDCEWDESLVQASRDADLFVCEAYSFDKRIKNHLDHRTLERHRGRLRARRIVLTHMGPEMLANLDRAAFECGRDGMTIEL
jgi:ribonuclease BN (tRNA processing enzyme)